MDIQVKVFSGVSSMEKDTKLFERIVEVHEDVEFPFEKVLEVIDVYLTYIEQRIKSTNDLQVWVRSHEDKAVKKESK